MAEKLNLKAGNKKFFWVLLLDDWTLLAIAWLIILLTNIFMRPEYARYIAFILLILPLGRNIKERMKQCSYSDENFSEKIKKTWRICWILVIITEFCFFIFG